MASYISGMTSGLDWTSMISQLVEMESRSIQLLETDKEEINDRYDSWVEVNSKLLSLKTVAASLSELDDFDQYTSSSSITGTTYDVDDMLSYAVGSNASQGSYSLKINNLAQAEKLGSISFSSLSEAVGIAGDLLINGNVVNIAADDSLNDIKNKINALNSGENPAGVTASIFTMGEGEYRLTLTSQETGSSGIDIANGSSSDVLGQLGFADDAVSLSNPITSGAQSSGFTSSTQDIEALLGLNSAASGNVTIAGQSIAIDLSSDSLQSIRDTINNNANLQTLGVSASIVSETNGSTTYYKLQIDGTQAITDTNNILQTLGFLRQGHSAVSGVTGDVSNTANGVTVTEDTLISDIDGYNTWTSGDTITIEGSDHDGVGVGPTDFTINSTSTLGEFLDAIETAFGNEVNAYVNSDGEIVVEDNQAGTSNLTLTLTAGIDDVNSTLGFGSFTSSTVRQRQVTAGEDAQITLDGVVITRETNMITDVITGVTLNLLNEDEDAQINLNITRDYDGIKQKISDFVSSYNDIISYINEQFEYDEEDGDTSPLFGDSSLMSVRSSIRNVILSGVTGLGSSLDHLSLVGINIDRYGELSIDDDKLDGYLRTNFTDIVNLFVAQGSSTNGNLTYVSSDTATQEGSYEIEVTQVATQANTTGTGFSGTLSGDTTISITDHWGRETEISLSAGWNITSIVNAINSEFSQEYEEILVGENSFYADAGQASVIDEDTTWDSVFDAVGVSAGLVSDDVISFGGTNRGGSTITGSFTITDAGSDSVGGLLNAIEEEFGSGYDAYIDTEGRIAIKDTVSGDSDITLSITALRNLDFGTIDIDATGADGSQEGRYSMSMTAENVGGQLKISNDDYGNYSFSISVTGGNLGITDNTYTGNDIEGRIRAEGSSSWMTMSGTGQALTVDDDQDAEALVVKYIGASTGAFDFNFTTGVGEKMDRALYFMTDTYDGYIANKKESLQDQMDNIDLKIEDEEIRLDRYEQNLMRKFIMMETMLTSMQSQLQWLTGQIESLGS